MITIKNLNFAYKRNRPVLEGLNIGLRPGHIYGLLGKNGEGKTTLLDLLVGQLFPVSGTCTVSDNIPSQRKADFLQKVFLLPEDVNLPDVTAAEYKQMYAAFYPTFREDLWTTCVKEFEIAVGDRLSKMSMGQRKKAAIALALSVHTPVLLMDEPTNALDIPSKAMFRKLVATCIEDDQTVVISTHQVRDLESLIDSVLILENHQILLDKGLDEVSGKLFFRLVAHGEPVLYVENTSAGLMGVGENKDNEHTDVYLELLFQAVTQNPGEIKRIFNN
ncbi:MAG: ABC transporter ATP-binding protein [Tannerella sp.]|jgi:ABC-2 type transport system ATP-binding protein|nr:ABC transporter ATP-binding protein [Tannerella sp.]